MLAAYLFDGTDGHPVEDWRAECTSLTNSKVLWLDLQGATEDELASVYSAFSVGEGHDHHRRGVRAEPQVHVHDGYIHITSIIAPDGDDRLDPTRGVLESIVGDNWVVTIHESDSPLVDDFKAVTSGPGQVGGLDAPSFLTTLLERVVLSYGDAFERIEERLEDFDADVLSSPDSNVDKMATILVDVRQRTGELRRALSPHRRVYSTLGHAEFSRVSTEASAARFRHLADQVDDALDSARWAKEAVVSSFDMLILRTENRTNEIVKVLTLTSILLLPGALIATILGMNVNLSGGDFATSGLFWVAIAGILLIAGGTLGFARARRWI